MLKKLCLALCILLSMPAFAINWMRDAAIVEFSDSDWDILRSEVSRVLNDVDDGEQVNWRNQATGNRGALKVLLSFDWQGQHCRRLAALNVNAKGVRGVMTQNLCRQDDNKWMFVSDSAIK
jgi:surface antigen